MPRDVLARNLMFLMSARGWKQQETAKAAGVDQKVISYILRKEKAPGIEVLEKLAQAFGLALWQFLTPELPEDQQSRHHISQVYDSFYAADDDGKRMIVQIAEREAQHAKPRD